MGYNTYSMGCLANKTCINPTLLSNHTLERFWDYSISDRELDKLPDDLVFCLDVNLEKNKANVARKKIFHFHLNGNFDLSPFLDIDLEVLPHVLDWIGRDYNSNNYDISQSRVTAYMYHMQYPRALWFSFKRNGIEMAVGKRNGFAKS